ncbi:MAG: TRAP transporter small permease subunit [Deltaproteobacteria bacterium]|nr:TRAP transporter small permease subunit [Deltaproteobacteria bacterium]
MFSVWEKFNRILAIIGGALLAAVMLMIVVDVCGRIFFNHPITGMVDTVTVLIPIFLFLPLAYVEILEGHIRVEVLTTIMTERKQRALDILASFCGVVLFAVFAWTGWEVAFESWQMAEYYPGLYEIRVYPSKFAIALGCTLYFVQLLGNGLIQTKRLFSKCSVESKTA